MHPRSPGLSSQREDCTDKLTLSNSSAQLQSQPFSHVVKSAALTVLLNSGSSPSSQPNLLQSGELGRESHPLGSIIQHLDHQVGQPASPPLFPLRDGA